MSGSVMIIALGGAAAIAVVALLFRGGSPAAACARAVADDDIAPVLAWIDRQPAVAQLDAFNRMIRQLWDDYERELATRLVRELAERHAESKIAQYWLDQVQRVEPEIAQQTLDRDFLARHFKPDVAAKCGQFG